MKLNPSVAFNFITASSPEEISFRGIMLAMENSRPSSNLFESIPAYSLCLRLQLLEFKKEISIKAIEFSVIRAGQK
jgi:hypothetical protein